MGAAGRSTYQAVSARWAVRNQKLTAELAPFLPVFRSGVTGLFDGVEVPVAPLSAGPTRD